MPVPLGISVLAISSAEALANQRLTGGASVCSMPCNKAAPTATPPATLAAFKKCGHLSVLRAIVPASKSAGKPIGRVIFDGGFFVPFFTTVFRMTGRNSLLSAGVAGLTTEGYGKASGDLEYM